MAFEFEVKMDPTQAVKGIADVEQGLVRIEGRARDASGQLASFGTSAQDGAAAAAQAIDGVHDALSRVGRGFEQVVEAMQREQSMLDRIRGPVQSYTDQLQALDALLNKDAISTIEYANQVARLNAEIERGNHLKAPEAPQASAGGGVMGQIGGVVEGAVAAIGAHEIMEMADAYTEVSNRLHVLTSNQYEFNVLMDATFGIAEKTRMSWETVASTYQRLKSATEDLGLSQDKLLRLTTEMGEGVKISGASTREASMAIGELMHAFETGSLTGREFKVLMKDTPAMMVELRNAAGLTAQEFSEMGKHGQITAETLIDWFGKADASITEKFGRTAPTLAEGWAMFHMELEKVIGEMHLGEAVMPALSAAAEVLVEAVRNLGRDLAPALELLKGMGSMLAEVAKVAGPAAKALSYINPIGQGGRLLKGAYDWLTEGTAQLESLSDMMARTGTETGATTESTKSLDDAMSKMLKSIKDPLKDHELQIRALNQLYADAKIGVDAYQEALHKLNAAQIKRDRDEFEGRMDRLRGMREAQDLEHKVNQTPEGKGIYIPLAHSITGVLPAEFEQANDDAMEAAHEVEAKMTAAAKAAKGYAHEASAAARALEELHRAMLSVERQATAEEAAELKLARAIDISEKAYRLHLDTVGKDGWALAEVARIVGETQADLDHVRWDKLTRDMAAAERQSTPLEAAQKKLANVTSVAGQAYQASVETLGEYGWSLAKAALLVGETGRETEKARLPFEAWVAKITEETRELHLNAAARERVAAIRKEEDALTKAGVVSLTAEQKAFIAARVAAKLYAEELQKPANVGWFSELKKTGEARSPLEGAKAGLNDIYNQTLAIGTSVKTSMVGAFNSLNQTIANGFVTGKFAWKDFAKTIEEDLIKLALQLLEMKLLMAAFSGIDGLGAVPTGIGAISGRVQYGGAHDDGGSYTVGGSGGRDSQHVLMRLTPGERVDVTPRGGSRGGGGGGTTRVVNVFDPRELTGGMSSRAGDKVLHNFVRRYPGAARSMFGTRR